MVAPTWGWSIGDVILILRISLKVYKSFADTRENAPREYQELANHFERFHVAFDKLQRLYPRIEQPSYRFYADIGKTVKKCEVVQDKFKSLTEKPEHWYSPASFERLQRFINWPFSKERIDSLKSELSSHTETLGLHNDYISLKQTFEFGKRIDNLERRLLNNEAQASLEELFARFNHDTPFSQGLFQRYGATEGSSQPQQHRQESYIPLDILKNSRRMQHERQAFINLLKDCERGLSDAEQGCHEARRLRRYREAIEAQLLRIDERQKRIAYGLKDSATSPGMIHDLWSPPSPALSESAHRNANLASDTPSSCFTTPSTGPPSTAFTVPSIGSPSISQESFEFSKELQDLSLGSSALPVNTAQPQDSIRTSNDKIKFIHTLLENSVGNFNKDVDKEISNRIREQIEGSDVFLPFEMETGCRIQKPIEGNNLFLPPAALSERQPEEHNLSNSIEHLPKSDDQCLVSAESTSSQISKSVGGGPVVLSWEPICRDSETGISTNPDYRPFSKCILSFSKRDEAGDLGLRVIYCPRSGTSSKIDYRIGKGIIPYVGMSLMQDPNEPTVPKQVVQLRKRKPSHYRKNSSTSQPPLHSPSLPTFEFTKAVDCKHLQELIYDAKLLSTSDISSLRAGSTRLSFGEAIRVWQDHQTGAVWLLSCASAHDQREFIEIAKRETKALDSSSIKKPKTVVLHRKSLRASGSSPSATRRSSFISAITLRSFSESSNESIDDTASSLVGADSLPSRSLIGFGKYPSLEMQFSRKADLKRFLTVWQADLVQGS